MKKLLLALVIVAVSLLLTACQPKTTKPVTTTTTEPECFEPYTDEDGKLNVCVLDPVFE